jgi:hypothetical protein
MDPDRPECIRGTSHPVGKANGPAGTDAEP